MSLLARRVSAQGLARRESTTIDVLRSWTVQDSPPGAAATAIAARAEEVTLKEALDDRSAVALYNPRTATAVLPSDEAAVFGTALLPPEEDEPARLAVEAIAGALDGRTLSRDDLHEELRRRLPEEMLPWCEGCQSHHARRWVLVTAGLHGRLCLAGRAGRQPAFARTDQWIGWDAPPREQAGAELVRRFRAAYPGAGPAELAGWAGIEGRHARELWARAGDEEPAPRTRRASGVRLLGAGDPLLLARDRDVLVGDGELRARVFRPAGAPGIVLADGEPAGLWRARKKGRRLEVEVEELRPLDAGAVRAEALRLAPLRGCADVAIGSARS